MYSNLDPTAEDFIPASARKTIGSELFTELIVPVFESRLGDFSEQLEKVYQAATVPNRRFGDVIGELICEQTFKSSDRISTGFRFIIKLRERLPHDTRTDVERGVMKYLCQYASDLFSSDNLQLILDSTTNQTGTQGSAYMRTCIQNALNVVHFTNLAVSRWTIHNENPSPPIQACLCICEALYAACSLQRSGNLPTMSFNVDEAIASFNITPVNCWPLILNTLLDTFAQCLPLLNTLLKSYNLSIRPDPWQSPASAQGQPTSLSSLRKSHPNDLVYMMELISEILAMVYQLVVRVEYLFKSQSLISTCVNVLITAGRVVGTNTINRITSNNANDSSSSKRVSSLTNGHAKTENGFPRAMETDLDGLHLSDREPTEDDYDAFYQEFLRDTNQLPE